MVQIRKGGFALLEIVIATFILLTVASVSFVMLGSTVILKNTQKTVEKLSKLGDAFVRYYDIYGEYPSSLSVLVPLFDGNDPMRDAWGRLIVYASPAVVDGTDYPAVFISGGRDGEIDSTLEDAGGKILVTPSGKDLIEYVTDGMIITTDRYVTLYKVKRANSALQMYYDSGGSDPACVSDNSTTCAPLLCSLGYMECLDGYDMWGERLVLVNKDGAFRFISCGYDETCGNSDDVVE